MRKALVIFLMSLYLLGATEAYQLLKMPFLFEHYKTHQQISANLSFSAFIDMHYFTTTSYDNDYQQDMQLPFKTSNRTISLLNFVSLFVPKQIIVPSIVFENSQAFLHFDDKKHDSNNLKNIFQPPRI